VLKSSGKHSLEIPQNTKDMMIEASMGCHFRLRSTPSVEMG